MLDSNNLRGKTLLASGFHAPERGSIDVLRDTLIAIGSDGVIQTVTRPGENGYQMALEAARRAGTLATVPSGTLLLPGPVDLHVHAPHYPQLARAVDVPLQVWLRKRTF